MPQTPAIDSKLAARPPELPAGKVLDKAANNAQGGFAQLLDQKKGVEATARTSGDAAAARGTRPLIRAQISGSEGEEAKDGSKSSGASANLPEMLQLTESPTIQQAASRSERNSTRALSSPAPSRGRHKGASTNQTGSPSEDAAASGTVRNDTSDSSNAVTAARSLGIGAVCFPAAGAGTGMQNNPGAAQCVTSDADGAAKVPPALESPQDAILVPKNIKAISPSNRPSAASAANAAQSFAVLDPQTHFAADEAPSLKLTQALNSEGTGKTDVSGPAPVSDSGEGGQPAAGRDHRSSHSSGGSPETALQPDLQAAAMGSTPGAAASVPGRAQPLPIQQVLDAIEAALPPLASAVPAAEANQLAPESTGPLKRLTIALDPEGLGSVSIELSIKNSELGVRLETSEAGTAQVLKQDNGELAKALETAGYAVASLSVHILSQPPAADVLLQGAGIGQGAFSMLNSAGGGGGNPGTGSQGSGANKRQDQKGNGYGPADGGNRKSYLYI
jgi:Flagellar hook-length control protein FliK